MNTNSNLYTVIYTSVVCVLVAAILAFVSQALAPRQEANEKAETISQILTAAGFGEKADWDSKGNDAILNYYKEHVDKAFLIDAKGEECGVLDISKAEIVTVSGLKKQNYAVLEVLTGKRPIKDGSELCLPVYQFKDSTTVVPIYGAGLWGPVWGYIAFKKDLKTIKGAYFDHESETPGLGGKIKDDPTFRKQFNDSHPNFNGSKDEVFEIVKGGAPKDKEDNKIDAITGATMTSNGLDNAIDNWLEVYKPFLNR